WIAKSSNNDGHYEGANGAQNLGKSVTLRNGRLLSEQPKIEFDTVFSTFKDIGLAYYKIKYFVYTMMFIIGLNLFRELSSIFSKLRK
ncbi:Pv-fam-h protein, partial [Plasmodium cynomolgi strain B]